MELETLDQVCTYIDRIAADLDPDSRYVRELRGLVLESRDVEDLQARMLRGCRGLRHSGPTVFGEMSFEDQLLANLITGETDVSRFESYELSFIRSLLRRMHNPLGMLHILVAPCSTGAEVYTYAMATIEDGVEACIWGKDIQYEALRAAARGVLDVGIPARFLAQPAKVSEEVLSRTKFDLVDLLQFDNQGLPGVYDLVSCRNFLGYFTLPVVQRILANLVPAMRPGGALVLDAFVVGKHREDGRLLVDATLQELGLHRKVPQYPVYVHR